MGGGHPIRMPGQCHHQVGSEHMAFPKATWRVQQWECEPIRAGGKQEAFSGDTPKQTLRSPGFEAEAVDRPATEGRARLRATFTRDRRETHPVLGSLEPRACPLGTGAVTFLFYVPQLGLRLAETRQKGLESLTTSLGSVGIV